MSHTTFQQYIDQGRLIDTHCHLNSPKYQNVREEIITNIQKHGVYAVVDIAVNLESTALVVDFASKYPETTIPCIGIDPEVYISGSDLECKDSDRIPKEFDKVCDIAEDLNRLGRDFLVGETGMDNYWNVKSGLTQSEISKSMVVQAQLFVQHIDLAKKYDKYLSIHSRDTVDECFEILIQNNVKKAIFHSLTPETGDDSVSFVSKFQKILDAGYYIGLNGIVTYKSANVLRDAVLARMQSRLSKSDIQDISPLDFYQAGFVFETDGPYLSPEGKRGELNEPANIKLVYDFLAKRLV